MCQTNRGLVSHGMWLFVPRRFKRQHIQEKILMNDKVLHFIAGFLLSMTGVIFSPLLLAGFIFAFGKEWYDGYTKTGVVEVNDIIATLLGAILAVVIVFCLKT